MVRGKRKTRKAACRTRWAAYFNMFGWYLRGGTYVGGTYTTLPYHVKDCKKKLVPLSLSSSTSSTSSTSSISREK